MNTFKLSWFKRGYRNGERDSKEKLVNPDYFNPDLMWTHYPKRSEITNEIEDNADNIFKCENILFDSNQTNFWCLFFNIF